MKTIKYKNVGEFKIITGIGQLIPDNHATGANSLPKIAELEISKTLAKKEKEKAGHFEKMRTSEVIAGDFLKQKSEAEKKKVDAEQVKKTARAAGNDTAAEACDVEIMNHCNDIKECEKGYHKHNKSYVSQGGSVETKNDEMRELLPELDAQQKKVRRENFVYGMPNNNILIDRGTLICMQCSDCDALFYLPAGDEFACSKCGFDCSEIMSHILVPDGKTVEDLFSKWVIKSDNEQILTSGASVADFRGKQYFYHDGAKWVESEIITELGVDKNTVVVDEYQDQACEWDQLEADYQEEIRLQRLTPEELTLEKTNKIAEALAASIKMRAELEITGTKPAAALTQSQAFYNAEIIKITEIYG